MAFIYETNENDQYDVFKTHSYKASSDQIKQAVLDWANNKNYQLVSWDDDFNEGSFVLPHMNLTVKIIMQNPRETSIDLFIESTYLFGNKKKSVALFMEIYDMLANKFEFKGLGLHA